MNVFFVEKDIVVDCAGNDIEVFVSISNGNNTAFEHLFKKYYDVLCDYCRGFLGERGGAEDVVQDVFIYFWEHRKSIVIATSLKAYLYTAVRHQALKLLRKRMIEQKHNPRLTEFVGYLLSVDYTLEEEEKIEQIKLIMQELPPQCLKVFLMNCLEEKKYAEIAAELDISVNTVKSHITKAYRLIREGVKTGELVLLMLWAVGRKTILEA